MTSRLSTQISLKMAERSEAKSAKRSFASKFEKLYIFDAKLRFALFASLLSVIFDGILADKKLVIIPGWVNFFYRYFFFSKFCTSL